MRLDLDDRFSIEGDGNSCFTLVQKSVITGEYAGRGKRPNPESIGQTRETAVGHFGNLRHALEGYSKYAVAMDHATMDISGIVAKLDQIDQTIQRLKID
jgi:hypothetical protein